MSERPAASGPAVPSDPLPDPSAAAALAPELRSTLSLSATLPALAARPRPPADPGGRPEAPPNRLAALFADPAAGDPFDPAPVADPRDHVLAAAFGCPDLFAVAARPGPARGRFVAAYVAEAGRLGERVLVLTPTPAAADATTRLLAAGGGPVVRAVAADEAAADLPADVAALSSHAVAAERAARWAAVEPVWDRLWDAACRLAEADADERRLAAERGSAPDESRAARRAAAEAALPALREEWKQLAPLVEAKKSGRVTTGAFWRAVFTGGVAARAAEVERQIREAERVIEETDAEAIRFDDQLVAVRQAREQAVADFRAGCEAVAAAGLTPPAAPTPDAVGDAARTADEARRAADADGPFARYPVVVGPMVALDDAAVTTVPFDRLLLDGADAVTDAEFAAAARLADRWLLIADLDPTPTPVYRNGRPAGPRFGFAARVWQALHRPAWVRDGDRLVARLEHLSAAELTREPLADRPEIELRFGTGPAGESVLAEVAFPPEVSAAEAESFLARELGEPRPAPAGPCQWHDATGGVTACWPTAESLGTGEWADLEPGVREQVVTAGGLPRTASVRFDRAASWDRPAAEAWVARHTAAARSARTAVLPHD